MKRKNIIIPIILLLSALTILPSCEVLLQGMTTNNSSNTTNNSNTTTNNSQKNTNSGSSSSTSLGKSTK